MARAIKGESGMHNATTALLAILAVSSISASAQEHDQLFRTAQVNGGSIEYSEHGNPEGEPVLFIHGGEVSGLLRPLAMEPALEDFRLIVMHRRGFAGSSDAESSYAVEQDAADALALLENLGLDRAHVVGHSTGGRVVFLMAMQAPLNLHSLTLMEPALPLVTYPEEGSEEYQELLTRARQRPVILPAYWYARRMVLHLAAQLGGLEELEDVPLVEQEVLARELERLIPGVFEQAYADASRSVRVDTARPAELRRDRLVGLDSYPPLRQPILFLRGEEGNSDQLSMAEGLDETQASVEIVSIEDADHFFPLIHREQTARVIADFLRRNPL
jgi:3-oxoadipate enol-lactonase